jgi:TusE/DsrC/DsvC family sulfur relay protein
MEKLIFRGRSYRIDDQGFLQDWQDWDEGFAEGGAPGVGISGGLTEQHWEVIRHIRARFKETGECPLVFSACRALGLRLRDLERLFPKGYLRGACKLAGITYRDRFVNYFGEPSSAPAPVAEGEEPVAERPTPTPPEAPLRGRVYRVDAWGFLVDPAEWDALYASNKAREMKLPGLSEKHWRVLDYLRTTFDENGTVPTVIECCKANGLELEELEALFPDGYHRGAVKIAGLCVRPGGSS